MEKDMSWLYFLMTIRFANTTNSYQCTWRVLWSCNKCFIDFQIIIFYLKASKSSVQCITKKTPPQRAGHHLVCTDRQPLPWIYNVPCK
jgi:hypothetical protein